MRGAGKPVDTGADRVGSAWTSAGGANAVGARVSKGSATSAAREHKLPDVLAPGLRVVFCGTAAGTASAAQGCYYAHPQNKFWRALFEAGLTPRLIAPPEYALLPSFGLGLTDIAKFVSGMDWQLPAGALGRAACDAMAEKIEAVSPGILAFTSLNAGRRFLRRAAATPGEQTETLGQTRIWLLPSPSPAANWKWDLGPWRELGATACGRGR